MPSFQSDLSILSSWLSSQFLYLNSAKCKYMFLPSHLLNFPSLSLAGSPIELISSFDILFTPGLNTLHLSAPVHEKFSVSSSSIFINLPHLPHLYASTPVLSVPFFTIHPLCGIQPPNLLHTLLNQYNIFHSN